jgi:hypothetical protein
MMCSGVCIASQWQIESAYSICCSTAAVTILASPNDGNASTDYNHLKLQICMKRLFSEQFDGWNASLGVSCMVAVTHCGTRADIC